MMDSSNWTIIVFMLLLIVESLCQNITQRKTSNVCKADADCPGNAYCEFNDSYDNGLCVCNNGFFIVTEDKRRNCYKVAEYDEICYRNEQCEIKLSSDAQCKDGFCQCKEGSHFVKRENACYKTSKIGEYCKFDNNCVGDDSHCKYGKCVCPFGKHPSHDQMMCLKNIQLGEECTEDEECVAEDSRCHNVCRCKTSHIISSDGAECLPIAGKLYDPCDEDIQCTTNIPFAYCNSTCICRENYHDVDYKCHVSVYLKGICERDENCIIPHSSCMQGRCACNNEYFEIRGTFCSDGNQNIQKNIIMYFVNYLLLIFLSLKFR